MALDDGERGEHLDLPLRVSGGGDMNAARYRNYLLTVLFLVWCFNGVDLRALGLVMQEVKTDLHLTDTQLGVITGIAFAFFYGVMGIQIARWADRGNRVRLLALTVAVWSLLVALSGQATTFLQLLLIRVGVGIGESGCLPTSQSLIADHFNRAERPRATALFLLGDCLAIFIGYFVAGWLNQLYGWRAMFMMLGLPGLLVAGLVRFTLKEPRLERSRVSHTTNAAVARTPPGLNQVCLSIWSNKTFRKLIVAFSLVNFFTGGVMQWQPAFLVRSFGLKSGELGTWMTISFGLGSLVGLYLGGTWASRHAANNERLQIKVMTIAVLSAGLISAFIYVVPDYHVAFGLIFLSTVIGSLTVGPMWALIQSLVLEPVRAASIAIVAFFSALIGTGLGPLAAGALSDALRPQFGEESLRCALFLLCPGSALAAWYLWGARKFVEQDLQRVRSGAISYAGDLN